MKKTFALNTEPHIADIGGLELAFQAEVFGDDFLEAYQILRDVQQASGVDPDDLTQADPDELRGISRALRVFLAQLMLPESAELITRLDVVQDGSLLASSHDMEEAAACAAQAKLGSRVAGGFDDAVFHALARGESGRRTTTPRR
ncbi:MULTISPECIES: hypothetical protein, partial [Streptomyces]|uniref:hypothetical protein n=1 Tax=Streptomyces TaxID=1883 RepID=UPI0004CD6241